MHVPYIFCVRFFWWFQQRQQRYSALWFYGYNEVSTMTLKKTVCRKWRWWYTFLEWCSFFDRSHVKLSSDTVPSPPFHFDTHKLPITTTMTTERRHPIGCQHGQTCDCHCWRSHCPWWIAWFHEAFGLWYWNRWCLPLFHHWQPCQGEELNNDVARREREMRKMYVLSN